MSALVVLGVTEAMGMHPVAAVSTIFRKAAGGLVSAIVLAFIVFGDKIKLDSL
jgi:hypothetical protein